MNKRSRDIVITPSLKSISLARVTHHGSKLLRSKNAVRPLVLFDLNQMGTRHLTVRPDVKFAWESHELVKEARQLWVDIEELLGLVKVQMEYLRENDKPDLYGDIAEPYSPYLKSGECSDDNLEINSLVEFGAGFQNRWSHGKPARNGVIYRGETSFYGWALEEEPMSEEMLSLLVDHP